MALPSTPYNQFSEEVSWDSLQRAIAASSGFQRWCLEQDGTSVQNKVVQNKDSLEQMVSRYLRETLETLAY
jgi:hypothetical protein